MHTTPQLIGRVVKRVGADIPIHVVDEMAKKMGSDLCKDCRQSDSQCFFESDVLVAKGFLRGLVVEEFQKTSHTLVAECPMRVMQNCRKLFGVDGSDEHFAYSEDMTSQTVLALASHIPNLRPHLQPTHWGGRASWCMPSASAPNKKVEKPDSRRPIINRHSWPSTRLESAVARCLDWVSGQYMPCQLHIDIQRVDAVIPRIHILICYTGSERPALNIWEWL